MKPRIVLVVYRPKHGQESALENVVANHLAVLSRENLVTDRKAVVMKARDGSIIEIFEWRSAEAIQSAHSNPAVLGLWEEFSKVCHYEKPVSIEEFHNLFSEFEPLDLTTYEQKELHQ
jgi:hypothetical protein